MGAQGSKEKGLLPPRAGKMRLGSFKRAVIAPGQTMSADNPVSFCETGGRDDREPEGWIRELKQINTSLDAEFGGRWLKETHAHKFNYHAPAKLAVSSPLLTDEWERGRRTGSSRLMCWGSLFPVAVELTVHAGLKAATLTSVQPRYIPGFRLLSEVIMVVRPRQLVATDPGQRLVELPTTVDGW
uniref:(California timema) hypothetical protein n=1 Tax=Timema californicum TaxID=61474 RepID=A0A7R9JGG8_TIMCA|nr:unnamed protein product [Timema californicum]